MSTIAVDNARPSAGGTSYSLTSGVAKALAVYDQTVPATDVSFNVSSISDDATGRFTVTFSNSFGDTDYSVVGGSDYTPGGYNAPGVVGIQSNKMSSSVRIGSENIFSDAQDRRNNVQWHGDLA